MMRGVVTAILLTVGLANSMGDASSQVIFATEGDYPPWNNKNASGQLEGFDIDYVHAICQLLDENCEIVSATFPGMMDLLADGSFDAIISGIAITKERQQKIDFSRPYMQLSVSFATFASSPLAVDPPKAKTDLLERLKSARIGVQKSTVNASLVEDLLPDAKLVTFGDQEALNAALSDGKVDAALAATQTWNDPKPAKPGALTVVGPRFTSAEYPILGTGLGIGVAKTKKRLKDALDNAVCDLGANETAAALSRKWFGEDLSIPCK